MLILIIRALGFQDVSKDLDRTTYIYIVLFETISFWIKKKLRMKGEKRGREVPGTF